MNGPTNRQQAVVEKLIVQYLTSNGYHRALQGLKEESRLLSANPMSLTGQYDQRRGIITDLLHLLVTSEEPSYYIKSFEHLAAWVDNSLDQYKPELRRILYPIFIHTFLDLMQKGSTAEAMQLMNRFKRRFRGDAAFPSKIRKQELDDLQTVTQPEHVKTNRMAQAARRMRYPVAMCAYSYALLECFLQAHKLKLPLHTINEHIGLQIKEGLPARLEQDPEAEEVSLLTGQAYGDAAIVNDDKQEPLELGLRKGLLEDLQAERQVKEAEEIPEVDEHGKKLTKKQQAAAKKKAEAERTKQTQDEGTRIDPKVEVPELPKGLEEEILEDIRNREDLSADNLPSAIFYTFVNTHQSLNCAGFSRTGAYVAGGFQDSSVRLYCMDGKLQETSERRRKRPREDAEGSGPAQGPYTEGGAILRGHSRPVYGLDFSLDERLLLSASGDGTVRLWSTEIGANLVAYRGHVFPVWDVATAPLGHYFASASADHTARVWVTERAQSLRMLAGHHSDVSAVRWHPNGDLLASASDDRTIRLWDVRDGRPRRILVGHGCGVTSLAFTPDGQHLLSGDEEGMLIAWDLKQAKRVHSSKAHSGPVWSLAVSHGSGAILASGGADNSLKLWDLQNSSQKGEDAHATASPSSSLSSLNVLQTYPTKATPVFTVTFSHRNLLMGSGALTLRKKQPQACGSGVI